MFKSFPINEKRGFQFRAEAYNVWNHPNRGGNSGGGVDFNPASPPLGKVLRLKVVAVRGRASGTC